MHICVSKLTIIGSDNSLSPGRRQAIIWTNAGILLIRPLGTNFNEILIEILTFLFMKMRLKVSSAKWRPFCLGLNVLNKICSREFKRSATHHILSFIHIILYEFIYCQKNSFISQNCLHTGCTGSSFWQLRVQPIMKIQHDVLSVPKCHQ